MSNSARPNDVVGMDFIEPIDNKYLLVTLNFLSKRVQLEVCKKADGESVLGGLRPWSQKYGPIRCLMTDQGRHFMGDQLKAWCKRGGISRRWSHAYDHRSHRLVERCNRSVLETLRRL